VTLEAYLDIEANSLTPDTIWCVGVKQGNTYEEHRTPESLQKHLDRLEGAEVYAHNGIKFDFPVLQKLWSTDFSKVILRDTLTLSKVANPKRTGGHSLDALGSVIGMQKIDFHDYSRYSPEMSDYLRQDCDVLEAIHRRVLKPELQGCPEEVIEMEHSVAFTIRDQVNNGWVFDIRGATELLMELKEKIYQAEEKVREVFKPIPVAVKEIQPKYKKDGSLSVVGIKEYGDQCLEIVGGPYTRIEWETFNLGSNQQVAKRLMARGWEPYLFTPKSGDPVINYDILEDIAEHTDIWEAKVIYEYIMLDKRRSMVSSWIEHYNEETGRIHGDVDPMGTATSRMAHRDPNVAQTPALGSPYGLECRRLFTVPKGYLQVGADASGLELRLLAHYMQDPQYTKEVLEGDVHWANVLALGLFPKGTPRVTDEDHPDYKGHEAARNKAKTFIYAFIYGAGVGKIALILGCTEAEASKAKQNFLKNTPALKALIDKVKGIARRTGSVPGLDGRRVPVDEDYKALNRLLQSAGAIFMKKALTLYTKYFKLWKLTGNRCGNIHDEFQDEILEKDARKAGRLMVSCMQAAGQQLNLRLPMDGEYKVGQSWAETH